MASVCSEKNGTRRILFVSGDGKRRAVRLGRCDLKQAESFRGRIEKIFAAGITGAMDTETAMWLKQLDDRMHKRLARVGLVTPRDRINATVGSLLAAFFETVNVKPGTFTTYAQTRQSLEAHFTKGRLLATITPLDAERWRQTLKDEGLAEATISKRVKTARQFFRMGIRWQLLSENPLADVKAGAQTNRERMHFVTRDEAKAVLDACPDLEWRLLFALSRFGGLRCPSEHLGLRWEDVDWDRKRMTVRSPKTEGHEGREHRMLPIFPELESLLLEAFSYAEPKAEYVIVRYRNKNANLRTQLQRIIKRAGLKAWPRLFHNLRSSRQTELAETFPIHVVCSWLGNTKAVAQDHYLQVHDAHFEQATAKPETDAGKEPENEPKKAAQNPAQYGAKPGCNDPKTPDANYEKSPDLQGEPALCASVQEEQVTPGGFEQSDNQSGNQALSKSSGAESGALGGGKGGSDAPTAPADPDLAAVAAAWPGLPPALRAGIVAMVKAASGAG